MLLTVTGVQGNGFTEVTASHKGQSMIFTTRAYSKVKLADQQRVFKEINDYWIYAGDAVQEKVWECYVKIREIMDMAIDNIRIALSLRHYIKEMYSVMPMNHFRRWLLTVGNLHIPSDVEVRITADSLYNQPDQTYLQHEYINLATIALAVRPMVPIWGEYIDQSTDQELYKENEVMGLISDCEIAHWPQDETGPDGAAVDTAFDKLLGYVRFCVADEQTALGRLWRGMSTVEVPVHLHSKVIVRRLTIVPLNDHTSHSIVANAYRYVRSNLNPAERSTADRVNEKRPESGGDDDDKTSFIEAHKTKGRVSPGDIEAFNLDAHDYLKLTQKVDPSIDLGILKQCIDSISTASIIPIHPHQVLISQWVMAKAFPSRAFYHVNKLATNYLIAQAQALIWHWGFRDIAAFMQVELLRHGEHGSTHQLSQPRSGARIPNRFKDEMISLFPHQKAPQYMGNGTPLKTDNMAGIAINTANASIMSSNWIFRGPPKLFTEAGQITTNQVLIVPQTIKSSITELVLHLGKLNK